jgi:competence protein ComEC
MAEMSRRSLTLAGLCVAVVLLLGFAAAGAAPTAPFQVSFIDIGQGDSTLLRSGDFAVLVGGGKPAAGPTVAAYLRQEGVPDVDVMLATHADSDHVGGLEDVVASGIPVREVLYNGYSGDTSTWYGFAKAVANQGLTLTAAQFGQTLEWGETAVYALNPLPGLANPEQNDVAVVLRVDHAAVHYLLPSDADSTVEAAIVARGTPVASQILKVGHHGSSYSTSAAFLAAVRPEQAVISVGPNSYGHPAAGTLQRLAAAGATVWRTDQNGTITISDDSASYIVQAEHVAHALFLPLVVRPEAPPLPTKLITL